MTYARMSDDELEIIFKDAEEYDDKIADLRAQLAACKRKSEQRREVLRLIWTNHENYIPDDIWYRISKSLEDE